MNTAIMAFEVLKTGGVGVGGTTGTVLHRSLMASRALISRSLAEVRLTQGIQNRQQFPVAGFVEQIASASTLDANGRGVRLVVVPVEEGLVISADRQVLAAAVGNLLQNAFKFTRPRTSVAVRVAANVERVLIEVQDECGGLPGGDASLASTCRGCQLPPSRSCSLEAAEPALRHDVPFRTSSRAAVPVVWRQVMS